MSTYFLEVGKAYEVVTHPEHSETFSGLRHYHHMFPQDTLVMCIQVLPVWHPLNTSGRLLGRFEGQVFINGKWVVFDQTLTVTDVKCFKETNL